MSTAAGSVRDGRTREATALTATMVAMLAGVALVTPLLPAYQQRWDLSVTTSTLVFALYIVGIVVALIGFGRLADAVGGRLVILGALLLGDLAALIALLAPDPAWLLAARVLHGLGVGLVPGATVVALTAAGVRSPTVAVLVSLATTTGIAAGLLLGGALTGVGTTSAWLVYLALLLVATLRTGADLLRRPEPVTARSGAWRPQGPAFPARQQGAFLRALAGTAVAFAAMAVFAGLGPQLVTGGAAGSPWTGAVVAATAYVVSGAAQLTLSRRWMLARTGAIVLAAGMLALAVGVREASPAIVLLAALLVGAGNGLLFPPTLHTAGRLAPADRRAGVVSTYYLAMYAGISLPLLGLGVLADATSLTAAVDVFALAVGGGALVLAVRGPAAPEPRAA